MLKLLHFSKNMTLSPQQFATICFLALMQGGGGLLDKSPSYISEKTDLLNRGVDAFAALDIHNRRKVMQWCVAWGVEMPKEIVEALKAEKEAMSDLLLSGIW